MHKSWSKFKEIVLPAIEKRNKAAKTQQTERLNQRKQVDNLKPGTTVMVKDSIRASKWNPIYKRPYTIVHQDSRGAYTLKDVLENTLPRKVTIDMMKVVPTKLKKTQQRVTQ